MSWRSYFDSYRRRRRLELAAEKHVCDEYGVWIDWRTGPYSDGTEYQAAYAFRPTPGDRVGHIIGKGIGPTKSKALFDLHRDLKGRPDVLQKLFLKMQYLMLRSVR